jgi:hypothetical protein
VGEAISDGVVAWAPARQAQHGLAQCSVCALHGEETEWERGVGGRLPSGLCQEDLNKFKI